MVPSHKNEGYELIAKRCPTCESLVMVKIQEISPGIEKYHGDFRCSSCGWNNQVSGHRIQNT